MKQPFTLKRIYQSPFLLLISIIISLIIIEALIMVFLSLLPALSEGAKIVLDPLLLFLLFSPVLYFFFLCPLITNIAHLKESEETIRMLNNECEHHVLEHTQNLQSLNQKLEDINTLNQAVLASIPFGMDIVDESFTILFLSPKLEALYGKEAIGKKCWEVYRDDKSVCPGCPLSKGMNLGETASIEAKGFFGGKTYQISHTAILYKGEKAILEVFQDISQRKEAEIKLNKLQAAIEQAADLVMVTDNHAKIEYVNTAFQELTGYKSEEVIGKRPNILESGLNDKLLYERLWSTITKGGVFKDVLINKKKNGELYYSEKTITPIRDAKGAIINFISTDKDITEYKHYEENLARANQELLELDRIKSDFINTISHELRTPIAMIKEGVSQVVEGLHGEINDKQRYFLSKSIDNVTRLTKIVNSILDISKLEAGKIELEAELFDIVELVRTVMGYLSLQAKDKKIELREHFSNEKIELVADRNKITQVFINLINNAIKFTDKGYVEVQINEKGNILECSIEDTGKGISAQALPKLFSKFQQFGRVYGPGEKGVGLGLAITKSIIDLHKGKIWVESQENKGTKFWFWLNKEL